MYSLKITRGATAWSVEMLDDKNVVMVLHADALNHLAAFLKELNSLTRAAQKVEIAWDGKSKLEMDPFA